MDDNWLEILDENIDAREIMRQVRTRIAQRSGYSPSDVDQEPVVIAKELWQEMFAPEELIITQQIGIWQHDCDIMPNSYKIAWRIPILGPLHAIVRRIINDEIRRYLLRSLDKQTRFNRQVLHALRDLARENARLHQEIEQLRRG